MKNINATGENPCSSCGVCLLSCSFKAISMKLDDKGFYTPYVDEDKCTGCGTCLKVCYKYLKKKIPFENTFKNKPVYAAWSKNKNSVIASSSGGVGHEMTFYYHSKGYKICGVVFDAPNDVCKHIIAQSPDDLERICTSKYLQSYTSDAFMKFSKGEKYLVTGTPCQIYGLRKWLQLKKMEDNFILVDFFCHGTPSFNLWIKYKKYICEKYGLDSKYTSVNFREKFPIPQWHKNIISISDITGNRYIKNKAFAEDLFFKFFLNNSCLNEACYECKLRLDNCLSDIRIADFWGAKYSKNETGVSLVIINTETGMKVWDTIQEQLHVEKCDFADLRKSQSTRYIPVPFKRSLIMKELKDDKSLDEIYDKYLKQSYIEKGLSFIKKGLSYIKRRFAI